MIRWGRSLESATGTPHRPVQQRAQGGSGRGRAEVQEDDARERQLKIKRTVRMREEKPC